MEDDKKEEKKEDAPESELLKIQREKYEKIIEDKNKIIKELLNAPVDKKEASKEDDEDDEEKEKQAEEERRKKRMAFYKKNIY